MVFNISLSSKTRHIDCKFRMGSHHRNNLCTGQVKGVATIPVHKNELNLQGNIFEVLILKCQWADFQPVNSSNYWVPKSSKFKKFLSYVIFIFFRKDFGKVIFLVSGSFHNSNKVIRIMSQSSIWQVHIFSMGLAFQLIHEASKSISLRFCRALNNT